MTFLLCSSSAEELACLVLRGHQAQCARGQHDYQEQVQAVMAGSWFSRDAQAPRPSRGIPPDIPPPGPCRRPDDAQLRRRQGPGL